MLGTVFNTVSRRSGRLKMLVGAAALTSTLSGAAVYAAYQEPPPPEVPDVLAREAELAQPIATSETIDGVTVTLNWAYADTNHLSVNYTISGLTISAPEDWEKYFGFTSYFAPILRDADGNTFSYSTNVPLTAPGTGNEITMQTEYYAQAVGQDGNAVINDYFNEQFDGQPPESIDLMFELTVGGGPRDIEGYPTPAAPIEPNDPIGPFQFDMTVPLAESVTVTPMETVQSSELPMTLQEVSVTPTQTDARICYNDPGWGVAIQPDNISLMIDQQPGLYAGGGMVGMPPSAPNQDSCFDITFNAVYEGDPSTLTLKIDALERSMGEGPEDWQAIEGVLEEQGIEIDVEGGANHVGANPVILHVPEGVDFNAAVDAAQVELGMRIEGPWQFTVDLQ
jgi:hypothetical protein